MMLCLHLFNRDYKGLYEPLVFVGNQPLAFYVSYFCDVCVPIFAFVSGYGLYFKYQQNKVNYNKGNLKRLKKLYLNLWVVIVLFPITLGFLFQKEEFLISFTKLFFNITAIQVSYSSIWWYFTTYVLIVMSSPILFYATKKYNSYLILLLSFIIYGIAFYFRVYRTDIFDNDFLRWIHFQGSRYGLVQFEFLLGALAFKENWNHQFSILCSKIRYRNITVVLLIILLIASRAIIPNFFVSPFSAIAFIMLWNQLSINGWLAKGLDFLAPHATNIWLCHSFFYVSFFKNFIYGPDIPVLIFLLLLLCSLISSYIINFFYNKIQVYI